MWFDNVAELVRIPVIGVLAYIVLLIFLRVSGNRTLSKFNAFDFVVTVALGSTLATILLNENVTLAEGAVAFALLIGLQFAVTWTSVRAHWVRRFVTGEPTMLLYRGHFLPSALRKSRILEDEVRAAVRTSGFCDLATIEAVVLETDGSISVIQRDGETVDSALSDVDAPKHLEAST